MYLDRIQTCPRMNTSNWQRNKRYNTDTGRKMTSFEEDETVSNWIDKKINSNGQHYDSDNQKGYSIKDSLNTDDRHTNKKIIYYKRSHTDSYKSSPVVINDNINFNNIKQKEGLILKEKHPRSKQEEVIFFPNKPNFRRLHNEPDNNISTNWQSEKIVHSKNKEFDLYELSNPDIWFKTQVQLLEKFSTSEGKTVWKDITQQESARITSRTPEWTNQNVNIRYRSTEFVPKDDYSLPSTGICLLLGKNGDNNEGHNKDNIDEFIIVPSEDIEVIEENRDIEREHGEKSSINNAANSGGQHHRSIMVRLSRALVGQIGEGYTIVNEGSDIFLRMPHRQPHRAQIDIEAKADENQLVYVGSSGRLTTVVSENTRRSRAALTIQATNTGLAAGRFRPKIRECGLETMRKINEDEVGILVDSVMIPPMHTHRFRIDLPMDRIGDGANCLVALCNDDGESVAVREVRIMRGDRCFCVWHCQCVCLNEDPKLICQELAEHQQIAAGLSPRERPRQVRAVCYPNDVTLNLLVVFTGVIFLLLSLGLLKAFLGLFFRYVGSWGIDQMLQTPRKLDRYYERNIRDRVVVFDEDGWPVHPDTKKRTVRLISKSMEFVLNVIFFITMPCIMLYNSLSRIGSHRKKNDETGSDSKINGNKCMSSHDMQRKEDRWRWRRRHRKRGISRWMTSQAEELSTDIWRNGLASQGISHPECTRPLLYEQRCRGKLYEQQTSVVDSEHDDTEYVLMQMQKSKESLTKSEQLQKSDVKE